MESVPECSSLTSCDVWGKPFHLQNLSFFTVETQISMAHLIDILWELNEIMYENMLYMLEGALYKS